MCRRAAIVPALLLAVVLLAGCGGQAQPGLKVVAVATPVATVARAAAAPAPTASVGIKVYVTGAVTRPGVYDLPADSRVEDAVKAAGGFVDGADAPRVNLAARVRDEEEIFVPKTGEALPAVATGGTLLDVNTASATQLRTTLAITSTLAGKIVSYRKAHGPFKSVEDLRLVPVPDDQMIRIRPLVVAR